MIKKWPWVEIKVISAVGIVYVRVKSSNMYRRVLSSRHTLVLDSIFSRESLARF